MLKIFNSLTKAKEVFEPLIPGRIGLYVCGVTVYDYCHIGHARSMIVFDTVVRYLRASGYHVDYVRNITDIDDKIIQRALENQENYTDLTTRFITALHEDATALGLLSPDHEPRATDYIQAMQALITQLLERQAAYIADNGDVCFDVRHFTDYGQLAAHDIDNLRSGVRIDMTSGKRDPLDFVLWKQAKPQEPAWPSPWGNGRPGWHIECSAMSTHLLGQPFDIHGGGLDLKFPHHENEIAQSEAACERTFAKIWMHAGLLQINHEKMSKSLGNFLTIRDVLAEYPVETLRYFMLAGHYRSSVNYSTDNLSQASSALARLYTALRDLPVVSRSTTTVEADYSQRFTAAMDDDFNTPEALTVLFDLARNIQRCREQGDLTMAAHLAAELRYCGGILGLLQQDPQAFFQTTVNAASNTAEINALIAAREAARQAKNWSLADQLRAELHALNVEIEDNAGGTRWRRKT